MRACPGVRIQFPLFDGSVPESREPSAKGQPHTRDVGSRAACVCPQPTHFKRRTQMFGNQNVSASEVLSTRDMNVRPGRDVTEIVRTFLTVAEAVVAHWVEYSKGL